MSKEEVSKNNIIDIDLNRRAEVRNISVFKIMRNFINSEKNTLD
ncbi:MAG: hypothetical protein RMJ13_06630 [Elusimicrobiota bacterium]|nr:hypothetical protein [Elusimicrobiota bacterium]